MKSPRVPGIPYGLRRAAQGVVKILMDMTALTGLSRDVDLQALVERAFSGYAGSLEAPAGWLPVLHEFLAERELQVLERRGFRTDEARAVLLHWARPGSLLKRAEALAEASRSSEFGMLAVLFKRVKNITRGFDGTFDDGLRARLAEPAEIALLKEMQARWPSIEVALVHERYGDAMRELSALSGPVDRFFAEVLVMSPEPGLREARLALLADLRRTVLNIADIAEVAPEEHPR